MEWTRLISCSAKSITLTAKGSQYSWRTGWKFAFYDEQRDWWSPPIKLGVPKVFDLITDPKEEYPATGLRSSWSAEPAMKIVAEFEHSLKKYPPIAPGTPDPYTPPNVASAEELAPQ
jgi:hypothetical protein